MIFTLTGTLGDFMGKEKIEKWMREQERRREREKQNERERERKRTKKGESRGRIILN